MQLSKEQVLDIPSLIESGETQMDIAIYFGVSRNSINRWVRILKKRGIPVKTKLGKPCTLTISSNKIKEPPCKKTTKA